MINLDKHPIPLEPSFYIVVLAAGIQLPPQLAEGKIANVEFFQDRLVAYTRDEAIKLTLKKLQAERPRLYAHGTSIGKWEVTHIEEISAKKMEELFKERANTQRKKEKETIGLEKNKLLKKIIETKDVDLLHRGIIDGKINAYEREYIHNKLTADLPDTAEKRITSPYDI